MYLKATIQKVTDFGYFANFGREQMFEQSNWNFGTANIFPWRGSGILPIRLVGNSSGERGLGTLSWPLSG
jgi:hypothetical protein